MPLETFFNLSEDKRNLIVSTAIVEFSIASYSKASINQICKNSNMAKGSFYQYFSDKLDLYVYIMTLAIEKKISFFSTVLVEFHTLSLREQFRLLYIKGIEFAITYPRYAALGEQFSKENEESAKAAVMKEGTKQSKSLFIQMIDQAKSKGEIDSNVDSLALSMMLQSLNHTVNDYILSRFETIMFEQDQDDIISFVDALLDIVFNGIQRSKK